MSDKARRTAYTVFFDGADITNDLSPYFLSLTYVDKEEDESDELTIEVQDRDRVWMTQWLSKAVVAAATSAAGTSEEEETTDYVVSSPTGVKLREDAGTSSKSAGSVPGGTTVAVSNVQDGWADLTVAGRLRHLKSDYVREATIGADGNTVYGDPIKPGGKPNLPPAKAAASGKPIMQVPSGRSGETAPTAGVPVASAESGGSAGIMPMRMLDRYPEMITLTDGGGGTREKPPARTVPTTKKSTKKSTGSGSGSQSKAVNKQSASGTLGPSTVLKIQATILPQYWGNDTPLDCGQFELDSIKASGPENKVTIKAMALPFSSTIQQTKKTKAWEGYNLKSIAGEIAGNGGLAVMYESSNNPTYARREQYKESDIVFLKRLCDDAGLSLKCTNNSIVIFDQKKYEANGEVLTIKYGDKSYTSYSFSVSTSDVEYQSCRVSYVDPVSGAVIEGIAKVEDYGNEKKNNQQLELTMKVGSASEAKALAEKHLRLRNKFAKSCTFNMPGNTSLVAGLTVKLEGWGLWDGKYIIKQATHKIKDNYTTSITLRNVLEGY